MPPNTNNPTSVSDRTEQPAPGHLEQLVERVRSANSVLVTVSKNPSIDQLAASIGLTLALNKLGKHATCVFSGKVPSTLEFLQPERTIETNTNSLRDFIISLDKSKADKLRYKVEDDFVRIFITPYRTSIREKDFSFSQGDFNIDLIITLGVNERTDLDGAIVAHGRILHDATVATLNTTPGKQKSQLGALNWVETRASSLSEMATDLVSRLDKNLFDSQIATALLTGLVAETDRFGNEKAQPHTMEVSSVLMTAGASPQLISNELKEPEEPAEEIPPVVETPEEETKAEEAEVSESEEQPKNDDGAIEIDHTEQPPEPEEEQNPDDILIDEEGKLRAIKELEAAREEAAQEEAAKIAAGEAPEPGQKSLVLEPPQLSGQLTANTIAEHEQASPAIDALGQKGEAPLLSRSGTPGAVDQRVPPEASEQQTLTEIEQSVNSPHLEEYKKADQTVADETAPPSPPVDDARAAVEEAAASTDAYRPEPINSLGATPVDLDLGHQPASSSGSQDDTARQDDTPAQDNNPASDQTTSEKPKAESDKPSPDSPPPVPPPFTPGV